MKKAYHALREATDTPLSPIQAQKELWKAVWKVPNVQPRVRLFLWKVLHEGLPLKQILVNRIGRGDLICDLCGVQEESMSHMLFHCEFAIRCWFSAPTPMLTSNLPLDMMQIAQNCLLAAPKDQQGLMVNTMWAI